MTSSYRPIHRRRRPLMASAWERDDPRGLRKSFEEACDALLADLRKYCHEPVNVDPTPDPGHVEPFGEWTSGCSSPALACSLLSDS